MIDHRRYAADLEWAAPYGGIRAVVLGAAGFIGQAVAQALIRAGADVSLLVRCRASAEAVFAQSAISARIYEADLADFDALKQLMRATRPNIVFNLAGYGVDLSEKDEQTAFRLNAQLPEAICEAFEPRQDSTWAGLEIVHAGSGAEYGPIGGDLAEESSAQPNSLYAQTKLAGSLGFARCCAAQGRRGVTARLFTVYGPGEPAWRLLPSLIAAASSGSALPLSNGDQKRDFTYLEDAAEGLLRLGLATAPPGEIVNLATGRLAAVREFIETAAGILGIPDDQLHFGALPARPWEMAHEAISLKRLEALTAWRPPTGIADGIRKTVSHPVLVRNWRI